MSGVPDVVVHMFEAHVGAHVVLDVQDGVHNVPSEQAASAQSIELWVMEAMIDTEVASGLNAAFKAIDAVDGSSFIKNLLGDFRVGPEVEGRGAGRLDGWSWSSSCGCSCLGGRQVHVVHVV